MDTKLKNTSKGWKILDIAAWLIAVISGTVAGLYGSIFVSLVHMYDISGIELGKDEVHDYYYNFWGVYINDGLEFSDYTVKIGTITTVFALIFLIAFICLCVSSGKFNRNQDGTIHLNWFDRIWSEIHIAMVAIFATLAVLVASPLVEIWHCEDWFGLYEPSVVDTYWFGMNNDYVIQICLLGMAVLILLTIISFISLIKKLKVHMFWEKSLIGGIVLGLARWIKKTFKESDNTMLKVLGIMILGAILCATWISLPIVIILILIFVPKIVDKFTAVKKGVDEVKNGNLNYKIPVGIDKQGIKGEMDRLAAGINEISHASSIAVQNELKNQRMKTELISNVSHDLKTPLTSMVSYIDLMKTEGLDSPNAPDYLNIIDEKTQRLKVLTEDLFEAAKASSGAIPVHIESIDMTSLINQSVGEMNTRLEERGLEVIIRNECEEDIDEEGNPISGARVMADGQLLWRVVENLLGNACKYALDNSRVYIDLNQVEGKADKRKKYVLLEMKNISKAQLNISADELMERFKRGDESRNTEGSGLGLAIAKDLTKLMNGEFELTIDGDLFKASVMMEKAI